MAKVDKSLFRDWNNGEKINEQEFERERELLRVAINDNYDRLANKYDKESVDALLGELRGPGWSQSINVKSNYDLIQELFQTRYTKEETDSFLQAKADKTTTYTKEAVNDLLDTLKGLGHGGESLASLKQEIENLNAIYSTDAERVAAINDVIKQFEIADEDLETLIENKANRSDVYTKPEVYNRQETYSKQEVNAIATLNTTEFVDGGSFLDTYSSQSATIDGGEF
jgi:hypothetical protein